METKSVTTENEIGDAISGLINIGLIVIVIVYGLNGKLTPNIIMLMLIIFLLNGINYKLRKIIRKLYDDAKQ